MISLVAPLPAGNALRVYLTPPTGAVSCNLLRRTADAFTGPTDPGAVQVAIGTSDNVITDVECLENGTSYTYRAYWFDASGKPLTGSDVAAGVPAASYVGSTIDPQTVVLNRVELGLAVEVARGTLKPSTGKIPVLRAPFTLATPSFPCVSVHLESTAPDVRFVGEVLYPDVVVPGGLGETEGWFARTQLNVVAVSQNADERIALRRALARIIQTNLTIFDSLGLMLIEFAQTDSEEFTDKGVPLYMSAGAFSCTSPVFVTDSVEAIIDATILLSTIQEPENA